MENKGIVNIQTDEVAESKYGYEITFETGLHFNLRQNEFGSSLCRDFIVLSDENNFGSLNVFFKYEEHANKALNSLNFDQKVGGNKMIISKYEIISGEIKHRLIAYITQAEGPFIIESNGKFRLEFKCSSMELVKIYN